MKIFLQLLNRIKKYACNNHHDVDGILDLINLSQLSLVKLIKDKHIL